MRMILAALVAFGAGALADATPARAELNQCGVKSNYFSGYVGETTPPAPIYGASSWISHRYGAVCNSDTSAGNWNAAWSMMNSLVGDWHGDYWAQTGYIRWYGTCTRHFSQWMAVDRTPRTYIYWAGGCIPDNGASNHYYEFVRPTTGHAEMWTDGVYFDQTDYNVLVTWPTPRTTQFFSETVYTESDVPGLVGSQTLQGGISYFDAALYGHYIPCTAYDIYAVNDSPRWAVYFEGCTQSHSWTQ